MKERVAQCFDVKDLLKRKRGVELTVESQRGGVQAGVTAQHMDKTWNTMMEEGEQIKPTCMCVHTVLVHLSTI